MPGWEPFRFDSPAGAVAALLAGVRPLGEADTEAVPLARAAGRILAQDVAADRPSPAADASAMDGYALRLADLALGPLPVAGEVRIGHEPPPLPPGACVRIVTGGAVPEGADAVIKREDVDESGGSIAAGGAAARLRPGENIRRRGENLGAGGGAVARGAVVTPGVAAALAAFGITLPTVYRRLAVHVVNTGDELVAPDEPSPTPWQLRDSNGPALGAMLAAAPYLSVRAYRLRDDEVALRDRVAASLNECDALLLTGGVSMGHRDLVAGVLAASGVRTVFHGVPQRPGKPVLAGVTDDGRPVLGLPGNPVSVMVTARRMAVPAIRRRAGVGGAARPAGGDDGAGGDGAAAPVVRLVNPDGRSIPLWWHRLVRLTGPGEAELVDTRGSGDLVSAARADGFVEVPPDRADAGPFPFHAWGL